MRVLGTAGHVDHGKSTLVRALTGMDPDRLKEEKARGMTIDLGFAWGQLPPLAPAALPETIGIVDVPGHIDFIKNMLAGIGGIDAAMLVIAADEGVMPQTREHLAILDLLGVAGAVVVLTKVDRVDDPEWLELVQMEVSDLLAPTHLHGAPIVSVSAVTGLGLAVLKERLAHLVAGLPPRRNRGVPRLAVDRVFSLSGFGTVGTGTLLDGELRVGDTVEILPAQLNARIRSLQTHRQPVEVGRAGSRLAVNLTGPRVDQLQRGDVVAHPATLQPTRLLDAQFCLLAAAPRPLKHNQTVDLFVGAAELRAVVRVLGSETIEPGQQGWVQLRLERPAVAVPGDRFILRQPSPSATLGGGRVLSAQPRRRWRRFDPQVLQRLATLARGQPDEVLLQSLDSLQMAFLATLRAAVDLEPEVAEEALQGLLRQQRLRMLAAGGEMLLVSHSAWQRFDASLVAAATEYHRQFPLRRGMPRSEARGRLQRLLPSATLPVRAFNLLLDGLIQSGAVEGDDVSLRLPAFRPLLTPAQQQRVERLLAAFAAAPSSPPIVQEVLQLLGQERELLEYLVDTGQLVWLGSEVLLRSEECAAQIRQVVAHLQAKGSVTLAEVRDLLQTSRKYAQALLEEMDARRITQRVGEGRVLVADD